MAFRPFFIHLNQPNLFEMIFNFGEGGDFSLAQWLTRISRHDDDV